MLPNAFLGKTAITTINQVRSFLNRYFQTRTNQTPIIKSQQQYYLCNQSTSEGVPFCDSFEVIIRTCLLKYDEKKTFYKSWLEINFKKQGWMIPRDKIEKSGLKTSEVIHEEIGLVNI
ncbi:hypothetical protein RF11_15030 [Thelohanellus kitauei]|uniref:VASt domain-containing protein n=1 Tax=Thelohanellus kitauei TaxID=669202 RepID=A0A0C2M9W4_THEKT|nr:hypothetical protein RF11_15030 [Thelohanellus kitauei]